MKTKRTLLALTFATLLAMAMVVPALADSSGDIVLSGTLPKTLSLTTNDSVAFGALTLGTCNPATNTGQVTVTSNAPWTVNTDATGDANAPAVTELSFKRSNTPLDACTGTFYTGTGPVFFWSGGPVDGGSTAVVYALTLQDFELNGGQTFSYTLTYTASN